MMTLPEEDSAPQHRPVVVEVQGERPFDLAPHLVAFVAASSFLVFAWPVILHAIEYVTI